MTEAEAKTKWCPFARTLENDTVRVGGVATPVAASINREVGNYDNSGNETVLFHGRHRCIASACMAWRWDTIAGLDGQNFPSDINGHCGLAGSPDARPPL